jgi:CheY-like chemotaxis protein
MSAARPRKLTLLLADDDDTFRLLVAEQLKRLPGVPERCSLHCVSDGTEAVQYVRGEALYSDRQKFPAPDLILLDERMLRMDGSEALQEIKKHESGVTVPVCMFSTAAQPQWMRLCYQRGASFCIKKPLDNATLGVKLRLIVDFCTLVLDLPANSFDR